MSATDGGDQLLASQFASEVLRRQQEDEACNGGDGDGREPFAGIREIVLDGEGVPTAIPRRPAPPPSSSMEGELRQLILNPQFLLGSVFALGSLVLLLAIANADAAAS